MSSASALAQRREASCRATHSKNAALKLSQGAGKCFLNLEISWHPGCLGWVCSQRTGINSAAGTLSSNSHGEFQRLQEQERGRAKSSIPADSSPV